MKRIARIAVAAVAALGIVVGGAGSASAISVSGYRSCSSGYVVKTTSSSIGYTSHKMEDNVKVQIATFAGSSGLMTNSRTWLNFTYGTWTISGVLNTASGTCTLKPL